MFRFKQFIVRQERAAMKVCTDACVLGAYADVDTADVSGTRLLDIGTGTGLLALMMAQRNPAAQIDAVELDDEAVVQARENMANSSFAERIRVVHQAIQSFAPGHSYDSILTNPPFYANHLRSPDAAVNRTLHTDDLSFTDLIHAVTRLLKPDGQWWVLLPPYETGLLTELAAAAGLTIFHQLYLRHNDRKPVFRIVSGLAYKRPRLPNRELFIYESTPGPTGKPIYTAEFRALLRDFYLIF